jgi:hypothetical protein
MFPDPNSVVPKFMAIPFSGGSKEVNLKEKKTNRITKMIDVIANDFFFLLFLNISCRINLF